MAARRKQQAQTWDADRYADQYAESQDYGDARYGDGYSDGYADNGYDEEERGLILQTDQSLVNVSSTVTQHGAPLLSFTRTMNRFYSNRKQRLSLGRHKCEVCGDRIRLWSYETPDGGRTHDGCYERLAWTWTHVYAQQQRLASEGRLD